MTAFAKEAGLKPQGAMDLRTYDPEDGEYWDFNRPEIMKKAVKKVHEEEPDLLFVCPLCAPFSSLQQWNYPRMQVEAVKNKLDQGLHHLYFSVLLCLVQYQAGRYFALEQPSRATSLRTEVTQQITSLPGVQAVTFEFACWA